MFFFFNDTATTEIYTLSLHDALPICNPFTVAAGAATQLVFTVQPSAVPAGAAITPAVQVTAEDPLRSEEHTSELQSRLHLVCRLLLEKKKNKQPHKRSHQTRRPTSHS